MANSHVFNVRSALRKVSYGFARTPRKPNWSEIECEFLLQEIKKNITVIRSRKPDGCGSRKTNKADMWYKMCMGLHNKRPAVTRSVRDLKDKWKKLQFMAKQQVARARANVATNRSQDGLIRIPKLVYRVMEARGQDPEKLGFCYVNVAQLVNPSDHLGMNQKVYVPMEQDAASSNLELGGESIKEENTMEQVESEFSIQIQNAISLAPGYNQTDQELMHLPIVTSVASTSTNSMLAVPVSLERAVTVSDAGLTSSSFSPHRLLQNKPKGVASHNNFRAYNQRTMRPTQSTSRQSRPFNSGLLNQTTRRNAGNNHRELDTQLHLEDSSHNNDQSDQLTNSFAASLNNLQTNRLKHTSCPASTVTSQSSDPFQALVGESSQLPGGAHRQRLCPKGLIGHICDEEVVELQREVLREEREKICLEKEVLEMQREKLKLEIMILRQQVNEQR